MSTDTKNVEAPASELAYVKIDESNKQEEEDIVDPWTVSSKSDTGINYEKLIG